MNLSKIIILSIALSACICASAQKPSIHKGAHEITGDIKVEQMVEKHIEFNERVQTIPGYRVCIAKLSGANSRSQAFSMKNKFSGEHPGTGVYVVFDEPNFVVKVGDFRSRLEAYAFLQKIKDSYSGTIIKDNVFSSAIEPEELVPETDDDANE
ncbi:MAG: SPOR domain-containing protein [Bacteroidales bacterium]|nr:SPOR domain-containing protein [Bacteroidales bacterium]